MHNHVKKDVKEAANETVNFLPMLFLIPLEKNQTDLIL